MPFGETAGHADHLETAIPQVVRLFRVQSEDTIGKLVVSRDECRDLPQPQDSCRGEPMSAIGRPEPSVFAADDDERIQKRSGLVDLLREPLGMRRRQVALKGRGLHGSQRERGDQDGPTAQRVAIGADRSTARVANERGHFGNVGTVQRNRHFGGFESPGFAPRRELATRLLSGLCLSHCFGASGRAFLSGRHDS